MLNELLDIVLDSQIKSDQEFINKIKELIKNNLIGMLDKTTKEISQQIKNLNAGNQKKNN